jgi:hypothetical protein
MMAVYEKALMAAGRPVDLPVRGGRHEHWD